MQDWSWFRETRALYGFVGAFIVIALAFLGSSAATVYMERSIDAAAQDLLSNALPSVSELMRATSAQHRLDVDVDLLARMRTAPDELLDELTNARAELDATLHAAMQTPDYAGERALYEREVAPRVLMVDAAITRLRGEVTREGGHEDGGVVAAVASLSAAAHDLDGGLAALAELNQAHGYNAVYRITSTRALTARAAIVLDLAACAVAVVAAAIALRGGRRFAWEARRKVDRESERAAELDVLAQRVAHDLMSPLAAVALSLAKVERESTAPETKRVLERARRALERSRQMVEGIYAFSGSGARPVSGASAPLRATLLEAVDETIAAEHGAPPSVEVQAFDELLVAMDRSVLGVVVTNLLSNAFKFTRDSHVRAVAVRARADERSVHVEVEDTGPGVPPGLERAIFEPYRRAPGVTQPGLGLGLATVKRLVLAHGGKLGVRRARSGGSVFWFELPRAAGSHVEAPAPEAQWPSGVPHPAH